MKLFNYSFEESTYIVDEATVKVLNDKSSVKRFFGNALFMLMAYFFLLLFPYAYEKLTTGTFRKIEFINIYLLVPLLLFYMLYIFFSLKFNRRKIFKKYFTYFFMLGVISFATIGFIGFIYLYFRENLLFFVIDIFITIFIAYKIFMELFKRIKKSVEISTPLQNKMSSFLEGIGGGLSIFGPIILAFNAWMNSRTGGEYNQTSDAIFVPFMPLLGFVAIYYFILIVYKGYYIIKYYEEYRQKYGYTIEDWYGKNSKEYKAEQLK